MKYFVNFFCKRNLLAFLAAFFLAGVLAHFYFHQAQTPVKRALEVPFSDLNGDIVEIGDWPANILVINFWATWCPPCLNEIPLLVELQEEHPPENLQVLGIGIDSGLKLREFTVQNKVNYPVLIGKSAGIDMSYDLGNSTGGLPFTVVIKNKVQIVKQIVGELSESNLREIEKILIDEK